MTDGPWRGGAVHVLDDRCTTCVFRPGNLMSLQPGRLAQLGAENVAADSALTCHQTLTYNSDYDAPPAVCRGFYDAYADRTLPLRLARLMGLIVFDPTPPKDRRP